MSWFRDSKKTHYFLSTFWYAMPRISLVFSSVEFYINLSSVHSFSGPYSSGVPYFSYIYCSLHLFIVIYLSVRNFPVSTTNERISCWLPSLVFLNEPSPWIFPVSIPWLLICFYLKYNMWSFKQNAFVEIVQLFSTPDDRNKGCWNVIWYFLT